MNQKQNALLSLQGLKSYYESRDGSEVAAVDGVDLELYPGEIVGIVGESGCGKSTVVRALMRLLDPSSVRIAGGKAVFCGKDLFGLSEREMCGIRGKDISMIFQDPLSALDPVYTIGDQIEEILKAHEHISKSEAKEKALELLREVNIPSPELRLNQYPHELSGGMQQRVVIAIALACRPQILIADEPTTALDVTVQAQILELIRELRDKLNIAVILITHNMGVVAAICDRMLVMYGGVVVEEGTCKEIFKAPKHPYTRGLLAAIPSIKEEKEELYTIPGQVDVMKVPVACCRFYKRCALAADICRRSEPELKGEGGHLCRCYMAADGAEGCSGGLGFGKEALHG